MVSTAKSFTPHTDPPSLYDGRRRVNMGTARGRWRADGLGGEDASGEGGMMGA